jgi:hypothetical protein
VSLLYQYVALTRLKTVLEIELDDETRDAELQDKIEAAGRIINEKAHRIFVPVTETRTFSAPASTTLAVSDLQPTPTPVVTLNGTPLVAGTDYRLLPHTLTGLQTAYTGLVRLQSGFVRRWGYASKPSSLVSVPVSRWGEDYAAYAVPSSPYAAYSPTPSEGIITVTGAWNYGSGIPADIAYLAETLAARMWAQRVRHYSDPAAGASGQAVAGGEPLWTSDMDLIITPYVRQPNGEATDG